MQYRWEIKLQSLSLLFFFFVFFFIIIFFLFLLEGFGEHTESWMAWHAGGRVLGLWRETSLPPKPYEFGSRLNSTRWCTLGLQISKAPQNDSHIKSFILFSSYTLFYDLPTKPSIPLLQLPFCFFPSSHTLVIHHLFLPLLKAFSLPSRLSCNGHKNCNSFHTSVTKTITFRYL